MPQFETEGSSLWRWLLGLVMLALVIWVAARLSGSERPRQAELPETAGPGAAAAPAAVESYESLVDEPLVTGAAFQAWVRDSAAIDERLDDHDYVEAGLLRLTSAVQWLADRSGNTGLQRNAASIRAAADRVTTGSASYTLDVQAVLVDAASLVEAMNERIGPDAVVERNVSEARDIAGSLDVESTIDRQRHRVYSYFDFMAEAIHVAGNRADAARP